MIAHHPVRALYSVYKYCMYLFQKELATVMSDIVK
jgi:hypothetical protein